MNRLCYILFFLLGGTLASAQDADIKILAINDLHSAVQHMPKLAFIVDSIRAIHPDALLFSGGDNRTGNPINDMYTEPNLPMVEMMNAMGFNFSTMGNHECDSGIESFVNTVNKSRATYVVANAHPADSLQVNIQPYRLFDHQGLRFGVMGVVQINETGIPDGHPDHFKGIRFSNPTEAVEQYSGLRDSCDVFIGLTHWGWANDTILADKHPEFDLIIGGHSHDVVPGVAHNGVMLVQAGSDGKFLNDIDLIVRNGRIVERRCKLISIAAASGVVAEVQSLLDKYSDNPALNRVVAQAATPFSTREELGNLMADGLRWAAQGEISFVNAGGVRLEAKEAGDITVSDILRLDPFGNEMIAVNLTGQEITEAIRQLITTDNHASAYVSGCRYSFATNGNEIEIHLFSEDGTALDLQKTYRVVVSSYVAKIVPVIATAQTQNLHRTTSDALIQFLESMQTVNYQGATRIIPSFR